jgi:hypothetical protein
MFKGLTLSMVIVVLMLLAPAYIMAFLDPDYSKNCEMAIHLPCIWVDN